MRCVTWEEMFSRRAIRRLGTVILVGGIALLAWGFATWKWGDPVTSLYTRWEQRELASSYDRIADRYAIPSAPAHAPARPGTRRAEIRAAAARFRSAAHEGQAIGRIVAPRLGLDMVMVDGTDSGTLKQGPGRDRRTFMPGEGELVYIAGHRTTYGAPFAHIERMRTGDRVVLEMPYAVAVYRVTRHVIVPSDDIGRLKSTGTEVVALQACHPRFSARERYIVYARLVGLKAVHVPRNSTTQ